jgi:hypothetical protein
VVPAGWCFKAKTNKFNSMKKIFTLVLGLMLAAAMFAADRRPTVTVTSAKKYDIVIDGRHYTSNYGTISISNLFSGRHDIQVYEMNRHFFMRTKSLVASSVFQLRNNDVQINIDRFGQLQISQSRFGRDWNGGDRDDHGRDYGRSDNHDRHF